MSDFFLNQIRITPVLFCLALGGSRLFSAPATGPLTVHPDNPRYFMDSTGKAVYLTGSHTWSNLQDITGYDEVPVQAFQDYLDLLEGYHHNYACSSTMSPS